MITWFEQQTELQRPMREWQEQEAECSRNLWELLELSAQRYGPVHSISGDRYRKVNALIAVMHVVGLLRLIEDE